MIKEEKYALKEAKDLIERHSQKKHLIKHLTNIETVLTKIDTPASLEQDKIVPIRGKYCTETEQTEMTKSLNISAYLLLVLIILFGGVIIYNLI